MKRNNDPHMKSNQGILFDNSDVTKMLEKRRMLYEIEEAFSIQGEEYRKNMEKLKLQEETIKKTDNKIQEKFIRHCKFLAENKDKRTRAKRHLEEERKIKEIKLNEIQIEEEALIQLDIQRSLLETKIEQMSCYEEFLKQVVESNHDQYADIRDLLQRFQVLQQLNRKFKEQKQEVENYLNDLNAQKSAFEKNQNLETMVLNNEIANYQKQYDAVDLKNMQILEEIKSEEIHTHTKMGTLAKLMLTIDNLNDTCKKSGVKIFKEKTDDTVKLSKHGFIRNAPETNSSSNNIYKYNINEVLSKLTTIQRTAECIRGIIDLANSKKETIKIR